MPHHQQTAYWHTLHYALAAEAYYALMGCPARLRIALPQRLKGSMAVANFELSNDWVLSIPIQTTDSAGTVEPVPPNDVFAAASSNLTALNAVIGTDAGGNPVLLVNALQPVGSNITVTVTDSAGLIAATQVFDIIQDTVDTNIVLDMAGATHTAQAVPVFTPPSPPPVPPSPP